MSRPALSSLAERQHSLSYAHEFGGGAAALVDVATLEAYWLVTTREPADIDTSQAPLGTRGPAFDALAATMRIWCYRPVPQ